MNSGKAAQLLSRQRHDYANHIQVIKGYMELGMPERALEYVDSVVQELARESYLFHATPPEIAVKLYEMLLWARDRGIRLRFGLLECEHSVGVMLSQGFPYNLGFRCQGSGPYTPSGLERIWNQHWTVPAIELCPGRLWGLITINRLVFISIPLGLVCNR